MRNRSYNHSCYCDHCGDHFYASRYDARFCTPAHRSAYHRAELIRSRRVERIKVQVDELARELTNLNVRDAALLEIANYVAGWITPVI